MDTILHNGKIRTMDVTNPQVQALAIRNGKVAAVGTNEEILALANKSTNCINLAGALAVPGFNDSHLHLLHHAVLSAQCELSGATSIGEIVRRMKTYIAEENAPGNKWIVGKSWNQDILEEKRFPTRQDLDVISAEHPIVVFRTCMHIAVLNTKGLQMLGFSKHTHAIPGGEFDVDTGIFKEAATYQLAESIMPASVEDVERYLRHAGKDLAQNGITSVQCDDFAFARNYEDVIAAFSGLARRNELTFRAYQQCRPPAGVSIEEYLAQSYDLSGCEHIYGLGPIKLMADGSLGARTAYLSRPYEDDPSVQGIASYTQEEMDALVMAAHNAGRAVAIHCIGDGSGYMAMHSIKKACAAKPNTGIRHGIIHCQITDQPLLDMFADMKILAYLQPIFLHADVHIAIDRVGQELAATSYTYKTMLEMGTPVSFGTDCPVESLNPLANIYCAVTRKDLNGQPREGFFSKECLTVDQALYAYTVGSAYCSYEETIKGRLKEGYLADIAVLSDDLYVIPPDAIKDVTVKMTLMGGKIVWRA